ncbi:hypothetical protein BDV93DRAFT_115685 [Ceratobasidium sp. AG-I]|nr:hypothetical protein BDV93DRAFT_115685 [Ceratobasidium sp. AG-I]
MLLKYTAGLTPFAHHCPKRIDWVGWGEGMTRWFHSETLVGFEPSCWMMEGTRAVGTNYLEQEHDPYRKFNHLTLLDFHPPTVRRISDSYTNSDLSVLFMILEDDSHDCNVFVDVIDEDTPAFTEGFEGGTIISRLPYRIVTRRMPNDRWSRWAIDGDRIMDVPLDSRTRIEMEGKLRSRAYTIE